MEIQNNINLAERTTFRIGGLAKHFVVVRTVRELKEALFYAKEKKLKCYILGGGSNIFFDDRGFDGLIIQMENSGHIRILEGERIDIWAGESLARILAFSRDNNLAGLENLAGIPGSLGGAIRGNAGAFGVVIADRLEKIRVLSKNEGEEREMSPEDCLFGYRKSLFKGNSELIVTGAVLRLEMSRKEEIGKKMAEIIKKRREKQPSGWFGSAGSFFENPVVDKQDLIARFERENGAKVREGKIPAAWLIEEVGLKGKRIGGLEVSEKHANFVINIGGGKAQDLIMLSSFIKQQVRDELGVQLKEEVEFCGY